MLGESASSLTGPDSDYRTRAGAKHGLWPGLVRVLEARR